MNIVICDDDKILLEKEIQTCEKFLEHQDTLESYFDSVQLKKDLFAKKQEVDLFILDIEMPNVDGIELKNIISELYEDTNILFVTSHMSYMKDAFGRKVIGFLSRWEYADKIGTYINKIRNKKKQNKYIVIDEGKNIIQLSQKRIFDITARRVYTIVRYAEYYNEDTNEIRLTDGIYRYSLQKWEEQLNIEEFYRLSRSTIISLRYVSCISDRIVEMVNGDFYRIPAGKKKLLCKKFCNYKCKTIVKMRLGT